MTTRHCVILRIAVVAIVIALSTLSSGRAASPPNPSTAETYVPVTIRARQETYHKIENDRRESSGTLLILIQGIKDEPLEHFNGSRFCFAIRTLGLLRADEASAPLMELIDVRFPGASHDPREPGDPDVIQALARIGKPASKAAVEYLAKDKSSKRAPMYVRVIALVEGVEVGKFMVERAAAAESDPEKKARLTKAIALFADADKVVP